MGWNTTVVILNDALSFIEEDAEFGKKLAFAARSVCSSRGMIDVGARSDRGSIGPAAKVIETHHMDSVVRVDVGGNTAVVVDSRYEPKFPTKEDRDSHQCFACGAVHDGIEPKYCETCGKALQERKTYYEALQRIRLCLENEELGGPEAALNLAREALIVGPMGERMDVLDWQAILEGRMTKEEAYAAIERPRDSDQQPERTRRHVSVKGGDDGR